MIAEPSGTLWDKVKPYSGWIETNEDPLKALQPLWDNAATAFETAGKHETSGLVSAWPDDNGHKYARQLADVLKASTDAAKPLRELGQLAASFVETVTTTKQAIVDLIETNQPLYEDIGRLREGAWEIAQANFANQVAQIAVDIMDQAVQAVRSMAGAVTPPVVPDLAAGAPAPPRSPWEVVQDNADTIGEVGKVLGDVGTALSIVALATSWIPGVNAVTAGAALIVNGAALGTKLLAKAAGANVSWMSIGGSALGVIPGGRLLAPGLPNAVKLGAARQFGGAAGRWMTKEMPLFSPGNAHTMIQPPTLGALKSNPLRAIEDAATYTHARNINGANKVVQAATFGKVHPHFDLSTPAGHVAGAVVGTAKKTAIGAGTRTAVHEADELLQNGANQ